MFGSSSRCQRKTISAPRWREGVSSNADRNGQGGGKGLVVSGHPVQCGLFK